MSDVEREQRQYDLIVGRLESYRAGGLSLRQLVDDLDALWNELHLVSAEWKGSFREQWWTLEQVLAVAIDRGYLDDLPEDHVVLIDEAVDQLRFLMDEVRSPSV